MTPVRSTASFRSQYLFTPQRAPSTYARPAAGTLAPQTGVAANLTNATSAAAARGESRPILGGLIDLGPSTGALGCGSEGTTGVPDRIGPFDFGPACDGHDACSDPLFERSDKSFSEVLECQANFARDIYNTNDGSLLSKVGAGLFSGVYTAAVGTVAMVQWAGNRIMDAFRGAGDAISRGWSVVSGWFGSLFG